MYGKQDRYVLKIDEKTGNVFVYDTYWGVVVARSNLKEHEAIKFIKELFDIGGK